MCVEGVTVFLVASKKSWIVWLMFRKESLCSVVCLTILNVTDFGGGGGMKSFTDKYLDRNIITLEFCFSSNATLFPSFRK